MAKIKVTGYLDTENVYPDHQDATDKTGLSDDGNAYWSTELDILEDLAFELVKD